jgi:hypothetical protein
MGFPFTIAPVAMRTASVVVEKTPATAIAQLAVEALAPRWVYCRKVYAAAALEPASGTVTDTAFPA